MWKREETAGNSSSRTKGPAFQPRTPPPCQPAVVLSQVLALQTYTPHSWSGAQCCKHAPCRGWGLAAYQDAGSNVVQSKGAKHCPHLLPTPNVGISVKPVLNAIACQRVLGDTIGTDMGIFRHQGMSHLPTSLCGGIWPSWEFFGNRAGRWSAGHQKDPPAGPCSPA